MTRTHRPLKFLGIVCLGLLLLPTGWALDWQTAAGHRSAGVNLSPTDKTGFTLLPGAITGIQFINQLSDAKAAENQIRLNGSGVALGDVDGDGLCDIYLCQLEGGNALYRNLGDWKFAEVPSAAGAACSNQFSTGAVLVDIDGDGDLDLLVNGIGTGTRLFRNDGQGKFTEDLNSGLLHRFGATTFIVPFITTTEARMRSMIAALERFRAGPLAKRFLFKHIPSFTSFEKPASPTGHMLTEPWHRAGFEPFRFTE